ncbi:MAG TPA: O-antigen ligase family protein [Solirubrobacteraceae bacterium]|nr:O-antigen ligase family protein [Solirubrobacteraceae bacterium]
MPSPAALVAGGSLCVLAFLAALARRDLVVAMGVLLLGVVQFEPAPSDGLFGVVIGLSAVTGHLRIGRLPMGITVLLALYAAMSLMSVTEAIYLGPAVLYLTITLYLLAFAVWLALYVDSEARARLVARAYVAGAVTMATVSTLAIFGALPGGELLLAEDATRAKGLFKDPNVFGPFLVPAGLLLVQEYIDPHLLRLKRRTSLLLLAIVAAGVLVSYSRAAWASFVVGIVIMLVVTVMRRRGRRRALALVSALATIALALLAVVALTGSGSFLNQRASLQSYDAQRFAAQSSGFALAGEHPLGVGPGQFEVYEPLSAHSLYVRAVAEQGYFGFALLIGLVGMTLALACRNALRGRSAWGIGSAALLAAWCGILFNSAFVDTLHWRHLWFVAALIWAASLRPQAGAARSA